VVKLGAHRAPSLTQLRGRDTHALCGPCVTRSRVGTHQSGAQYPRDNLFKGRNIQELSVGDTSVEDTSTLHHTLPTLPTLPTRWSSMCGPSVHPTEGRQSNKPGQGGRRSRPDAPLIH
jgi:hypothetical protein